MLQLFDFFLLQLHLIDLFPLMAISIFILSLSVFFRILTNQHTISLTVTVDVNHAGCLC